MFKLIFPVCLALLVSGCGMNHAVGVLPNTLDGLAAQRTAEAPRPAG